jgi:hypothetical protein
MLVSAQRVVAVLLSVSCFIPLAVFAAGVEVLSLFPSDRFTVHDRTQNTGRRVNLAKPDCTVYVVRCQDIDVLNTLDGFNIQPRLSVAFSGPIDVSSSSVNSDSIFLVSLGSTLGRGSLGDKVGINQIVWDPQTNTLHAESDELLEQHTRYALVVTDRVRDAQGNPVQARRFSHRNHDDDDDDVMEGSARRHGHGRIVAASIFTTQTITTTLERIRDQIKVSHPAPATFNIGFAGERAVFPLSSVTSVLFNRQNAVTPPLTTAPMPTQALGVIPGAVSSLAFGSYLSPDYQAPGEYIPPVGTRTGVPVPRRMNTVYFNLVLPAGPRPAAGWPVAIFGHGFGDSRHNSPFVVAASMAARGIATIAINVVGHGGGPLGTVTVNRGAGAPSISFPAGGRGIDQNGDGVIDSTEGSAAAAPRTLIGSADALRQTTVDLIQLVRQIQVGIDVDGDGAPDLDPARIYYFGQSFGGMYGTIFLGIERDVHVAVPNVPGGAVIDIIRLSPGFRFAILTPAVAARGLLNLPPLPNGTPQFNENLPLRDLPAVINTVPGAMALQDYFEQAEWGSQVGNPVAYAPYIRKAPLKGNPVKSVIFQIAKGDMTVPNPTNTAILRAGDLQDRTTYYRNDLAFALGSGVRNPHTFLTNIASTPLAALNALQAQAQIAVFFASDGALTIDPDGGNPLFETPIVPPLPERLNFLP